MPTSVERGGPLWQARRSRAVALQTERPHAASLLNSYLGVLDCQEPLYKTSRDARWPDLYNPESNPPPRLRLERLPYESLARPFGEFVREVQKVMPETLAPAAMALDTGNLSLNADVLRDTALRQPLSASIQSLQIEVTALEFFCRAFLQPIVEALAHRQDRPLNQAGATVCPLCNWPPQFATLQDETEVQGRRSPCAQSSGRSHERSASNAGRLTQKVSIITWPIACLICESRHATPVAPTSKSLTFEQRAF
jgi:hypothetical protein